MKKQSFALLILMLACVYFIAACKSNIDQPPSENTSDVGSVEGSVAISTEQLELCEKISRSLSTNEIEKAVSLSFQLVQPLSSQEEAVVMKALSQRINNRMKTFANSFGSKDILISEDILAEINNYQTIVDNTGTANNDNTNIPDYLSKVSALKEYVHYNDYWEYFYLTIDDWNKANQYWSSACDSFSEHMKNQYLTKALNHFNVCLEKTYDYATSSFGIDETRGLLTLYVDKINYYFATGKDLVINPEIMSAYTEAYEKVTKEFVSQTTEFARKVEGLQTAVYYD